MARTTQHAVNLLELRNHVKNLSPLQGGIADGFFEALPAGLKRMAARFEV